MVNIKKILLLILKRLIVFIGYIPIFFAWLIPLYSFSDDNYVQYHGKQSLILSIGFVVSYSLIFSISHFPFIGEYFEHLYAPISYWIYIIYVGLSFLCGFLSIFLKQGLRLPIIRKIVYKLEL
jgi:hypothetical protein